MVRKARTRVIRELQLSSLFDAIEHPVVPLKEAIIGSAQCVLVLEDGQRLFARWPLGARPIAEDLWATLRRADVPVVAEHAGNPKALLMIVFMVAYLVMIFTLLRRMGNGGARKNWGDARQQLLRSQSQGSEALVTRFSDIAGIDEAKLQVKEVVDMMKNPSQYAVLGARVPRGVLLVGPPGSGKTLLARACAAEAGVPFLSAAATEFVELFVGRGAQRVRQLFEKARKVAPCIVFIDEVDALRARGNDLLRVGGNQEAEQTLNQLLASMDGLTARAGGKPVVVMGATNRVEVLDEALLRPGRFDRVVKVGLPNTEGRLQVLRVHLRLKGVPLASDVANGDALQRLAARAEGFAGAALEALVNEAAIRAARRGSTTVSARDFDDAFSDYSNSRNGAAKFPFTLS